MVEFYLEIRGVHIGSVMASGILFLVRGLALNLFGQRWALAWPLRYLSWTVDTILLTAKVVLLVPYIVLGYMALRGKNRRTRLVSMAGAALTFLCIYSVARAHDPLGFLA